MQEQTDLQFWTKQIKDQYVYLDTLRGQYANMNKERFALIWTSACGQLEYFINKATELGREN